MNVAILTLRGRAIKFIFLRDMNISAHILNKRGSSLIASVITLALVGYMGASLLQLGGAGDRAATNEFQTTQAMQAGNGGIQYALQKLEAGLSPDIENKALSTGTFTVETDPVTRQLTVTGKAGLAKKVQNLTTEFTPDVLIVDTTPAFLSPNGKNLEGFEFVKDGHAAAVLTSVKVTWNTSVCAQTLSCGDAAVVIDDDSKDKDKDDGADGSKGKQTVCHIPPGNPANQHTINVGTSAVNAHLAHGDVLGSCSPEEVATPLVCEGYDDEITKCAESTSDASVTGLTLNGIEIDLEGKTYQSGESIEAADYVFTSDGTYDDNAVEFDAALPDGSWYSLTFVFADGGEITESFKFEP